MKLTRTVCIPTRIYMFLKENKESGDADDDKFTGEL